MDQDENIDEATRTKVRDIFSSFVSENPSEADDKHYSAKEDKDQLQESITRSLKLISIRPRTQKEIFEFVERKFGIKLVEKTLEFLKSKNFVNDLEFAKWWIEQRNEFRPKGNIILKYELQQKGVSPEIIETALSKSSNEEEALKKLFQKKLTKFGDLKNRENFQKAAQFFQRRGFSWETISKILKEKV